MPAKDDSCAADSEVPECATGPVGRMTFVGAELRDVWRELRARMNRQSRDGDESETDKQGSV